MKVSKFGSIYLDKDKNLCIKDFHFDGDDGENPTYHGMMIAISDFIRDTADQFPISRKSIQFFGGHIEAKERETISKKKSGSGGAL